MDRVNCNRPSPLLANIVLLVPLRITISLTIFKKHLLWRGFHTLIRNALIPSTTDVRSLHPPPFGSPMSSLAHRPVFGYDIICNSPSPPLTVIVCFSPLCIVVSLTIFKTRLSRRGFHTLVRNCFVLLSGRCKNSHKPSNFT